MRYALLLLLGLLTAIPSAPADAQLFLRFRVLKAAPPPAPPGNTGFPQFTQNGADVIVTWDASAGAETYAGTYVAADGTPGTTAFSGLTSPTHTITIAEDFEFCVHAVHSVSGTSATRCSTYAAPQPSMLTLGWSTPSGQVDGYRVYHGTSTGTYIQSAGNGIPVQGNSWASSGLTGDNYFAVTAHNTGGESVFSNEICFDFAANAQCSATMPNANLLFRTGFEANSAPFNTVLDEDPPPITGVDNSVGAPNDWSDLQVFKAVYVTGSATDRWAKIVTDPTDAGNRVMHFWLNQALPGGPTGANSRVQFNLMEPSRPMERFQRVRMYIHPDYLLMLDSGAPHQWNMFQEIWIRPSWTGIANPFRISFNLDRVDDGTGSEKFYWRIVADRCCAPTHIQTEYWKVKNSTVAVPIGEWFLAETYYKAGDANTGRLMLTITRDGQSPEVVADVTNWTYSPSEAPEGIYEWNPFKLYSAPPQVDAVRNAGGTMQIYWDDWEIWDGIP